MSPSEWPSCANCGAEASIYWPTHCDKCLNDPERLGPLGADLIKFERANEEADAIIKKLRPPPISAPNFDDRKEEDRWF
jgi:hypothetical protein